jgi:hypothetical protein
LLLIAEYFEGAAGDKSASERMAKLMPLTTLKEALSDWTDFDFAAYDLALCLGLMSADIEFATRAKHVFWAANPIGTMLYQMLHELAKQSILEERDEPDHQFRWNTNFKGSWEVVF